MGSGLWDYIVSPSPFPLDSGFWTWILDIDFGLRYGTWIWDWTWAGQKELCSFDMDIGHFFNMISRCKAKPVITMKKN